MHFYGKDRIRFKIVVGHKERMKIEREWKTFKQSVKQQVKERQKGKEERKTQTIICNKSRQERREKLK